MLAHRRETDIGARFDGTRNEARILDREEAFWHPDIKRDRQEERREGDAERHRTVLQHEIKASAIASEAAVEDTFRPLQKLDRLLVMIGLFQNARAKHWRQRQ